ncbi:MAG: hypothetical protein ABIO02_05135 [Patescibacteria group bacterium]
MKVAGILLISIGLATLFFIVLSIFNRGPENVSPIHEDDGVKVIYETPSE